MIYNYYRSIYLNETDAAGVIFFANLLIICHQGYEESLTKFGINLNSLVSETGSVIPIIHSESNYFKPIFWADHLLIKIESQLINDTEFELNYTIFKADTNLKLATAKTCHVAIDINTKKRCTLPDKIYQWLNINI